MDKMNQIIHHKSLQYSHYKYTEKRVMLATRNKFT